MSKCIKTKLCHKYFDIQLFKKDFIYLFLERGEGKKKEREGNIDVTEKHQSVSSCMCPNQGSNLKPRHVPWLGIEPATFWFVGQCPIEPHWSGLIYLMPVISNMFCFTFWLFVVFLFFVFGFFWRGFLAKETNSEDSD